MNFDDGSKLMQPSDNNTGAKWIDISIPIRNGMLQWPGDPVVKVDRVRDLGRGDSHNISQLSLSSHSGTHIDAPLHFLKHGVGVDKLPLDVSNGRARVLEIKDDDSITPEELIGQNIHAGERILFKTRNSPAIRNSARFVERFVFLTEAAARFLVDCRVSLIGIDYLSVGGYIGGAEVHSILLKAGIWILESLDLSDVTPGEYELLCLPLKIIDGDGAPARAVLRPLGNSGDI